MKYSKKKTTNLWLAALTSFAVLFIAATIGTPSANLTAGGQPLEEQVLGAGQEEIPSTNNASAANSSTTTSSPGSILKLSNANVEIDIPLMKGYENGNEIFFIATDSSDNQTAAQITNTTGFKVNFAPILARTPEEARGQTYVFENGIEGEGPLGFQLPVINARPGQ